MKKIFKSLFVVVAVAGLAVAATSSFFSDTETSTGNVLQAGAIDLLIDNESYAIDWNIPEYKGVRTGAFVASEHTSWGLTDLDDELFFDFVDLKPGDYGEDTISLRVTNNDAYACMDINLTSTPENGLTEPEGLEDQTGGENEGELQDELKFVFWADDGDNVFELHEQESIIAEGTAGDIFDGSSWTLADSTKNVWNSEGGPLTGSDSLEDAYYVGKFWCFGDLTKAPVEGGTSPLDNTGFTCNGKNTGNAAQTDGIYADVNFNAVQARHNEDFVCNPPERDIAFVLNQESPGLDENASNETLDRPYIDWEILGECVDLTFHNPSYAHFEFTYRVDNEPGYEGTYSDVLIDEGPLNGEYIGDYYNQVYVAPETSEVRKVCGEEIIETGLRVGGEQNWYLDWITFNAVEI